MADNWQLKAVLSANAAGMLKAFGDIQKTAKTARKYLLDVGSAAGNVGSKLGVPTALLGGMFAGFGVNSLKNAMIGITELEDEVSKFEATTGIAGAEFKKFQYLAKLGNVPFESFASSVGKLNKNIYDAATGKSKELSSLFMKLGISTRGANGEIRGAASMLPELADAMKRNENPAVRARIGMALFGKAWQDIMPMLSDGSDKINQQIARFRELGLEVKDVDAFKKQMEAAGRFGDRLDDLSFVTKGFQNTIAAGLLPVIEPLINDMIKWIATNKELVSVEVKNFVTDLADGLKEIDWKAVIADAKSLVKGMGEFIDSVGGAKNALIGLAVVMNMSTIMAFVEFGGSVLRLAKYLSGPLMTAMRAAWAMMAANPMLLLAAAVIGLGLIVYENWDKIVEYVSDAWGRIKGVFDVGFFDGMIQLWMEAWQGMANAIVGIIKTITPDFLMPEAFKNYKVTFATESAKNITKSVVGQQEPRPQLLQSQKVRADGQIKVSFDNAPLGMRVTQAGAKGDIPINTAVGYRSEALGLPGL